MCGIAGIVSPGSLQKKHKMIMEDMLKVQQHRGPDYQMSQEFHSNTLLGHNRLSIIDLSEQANQPMHSTCGRYVIIFNGEIYNYKEIRREIASNYSFKTNSDTEVLLAACITWGVKALDRLVGMFAFAFYDIQEQRLLLVRDRFGVKPLYYAFNPQGVLIFASEIKTLHTAGIPKIRNAGVWAAYFLHGRYQFENQTFWDGIYHIPSGHYALLDCQNPKQSFKIRPWYFFIDAIKSLRGNPSYLGRTQVEHQEKYQTLLEDSIALRFRSDVPVGFNISGGLDSSILLGVINMQSKQAAIEAFTFYCNDDRYDELPWVEKLIAETKVRLNPIQLKVEEVPTLAKIISHYQDEPYGGIPTIAYAKIFAAARQKGTLVLLDGQGMDEAWAGYDYYHNDSNAIVQGLKSNPFRPEVFHSEFTSQAKVENIATPFKEELLNKQFRDLFYTKIPRALRFNDRISMMYSTELREPFLDHRLIEYAFALPASMKLRNNQVKWALRNLAKSYLNSHITLAPKRPLQTPQREWLSENLAPWIEDYILGILKQNIWVKPAALEKAWNQFQSSNRDNTFFLWQWYSLASIDNN